jgi:serine/threonine protein kinase
MSIMITPKWKRDPSNGNFPSDNVRMAPELMLKKQYSNLTDVWSFGVTIYEIVEEKLPYPGTST